MRRRGAGEAGLDWRGAARFLRRHLAFITGLAFLILYTLTLSPGLLPADAGEYQVVGAVLGVAHPPGFALYTMASWLVSRVPGVPPATAINFLSALLAAGALALLGRATERFTGSAWAGLAAALVLGLSTTFWAQATTANIRMPAAFATAWALERLAAYRAALADEPAAAETKLAWLALAMGVGVAHHASLVFLMLVLGAYAVWLRPGALRRPWRPLLAGLLPFAAWLYFPLRAGSFGAPAQIATLNGFLEHVLARGFAGDLFYFARWTALPERARIFGNILGFEFNEAALRLMAIGGVLGLWRDHKLGIALVAATAAHSFVAMTYRAPQTVEYLLPAYVVMAVWAGVAVAEGQRWLGNTGPGQQRPWLAGAAAAAVIALVAVGQALATLPSYAWLARDDSTRAYARGVLEAAPPEAVVLANWHWATPMWYLQQVEGRRTDVEVRYVFPAGQSLAETWTDEIAAALPHGPVLVTSYFAAEYRAMPAVFVPLGPAWEVRAQPPRDAPPGLTGGQSFGAWDFLGYRLDSVSAQAVVVTAAWRAASTPAADVSVFMHLLAPDGSLHSQMDVRYAAGSVAAGEVLLDRYTLPLRPDAVAGAYQLAAGVYRPEDGTRLAEAALAGVDVPAQPFAAVGVPDGALPFGNEIWFTGASVEPTEPVHAGDTIRVDLHFLAARPITNDYTVSVALVGPNYQWQTLSDATPAGGAIPTLKWIAGSRVTDTHALTIPAGAAPGTARLVLTIYNAFTQQPLLALDLARAEAGGGVVVGEVEVR